MSKKRKMTRTEIINHAIWIGVAKFLGASNNLIAAQAAFDGIKYFPKTKKPKKK
jgi:hypothetical protein